MVSRGLTGVGSSDDGGGVTDVFRAEWGLTGGAAGRCMKLALRERTDGRVSPQ